METVEPTEQPRWRQVLVLTLGELAFAVLAVPLYAFLVLPRHGEGAFPGFWPPIADGANPLLAVLAAFGVLAIALAAAVLLPRLLGPECFVTDELNELMDGYTMLDLVPVFLAAGFAEEFLFRVVLVDLTGLLISSLLFMAVHLAYWRKPVLMADAFALALLLGALYLFTGSLLLCASIHAAYNLLVSYFMKAGIIARR